MILGVVQARMGSSRLPGKVLADLGGRPVIDRVIRRLESSSSIDQVVLATSSNPVDDPLALWATDNGVALVRGDEFDVLNRFHTVLEGYPRAEHIVRVTGDCPLVDPALVDQLVRVHLESGADFSANRLPPPAGRTTPVGLDIEIATRAALGVAWAEASLASDREHVMPYLYRSPNQFDVRIVDMERDLSHHRWTVDTPEDLTAVRRLWGLLRDPLVGWEEILAVAEAHPEIEDLNSGITQKRLDVVDERWNA